MTTKAQWHKIKWSLLSRLPADTPNLTQFHMPFLQTTYSNPDDTGLHITTVDSMQQEIKALQANERNQPSDTNALSVQENRNQDKIVGTIPYTPTEL